MDAVLLYHREGALECSNLGRLLSFCWQWRLAHGLPLPRLLNSPCSTPCKKAAGLSHCEQMGRKSRFVCEQAGSSFNCATPNRAAHALWWKTQSVRSQCNILAVAMAMAGPRSVWRAADLFRSAVKVYMGERHSQSKVKHATPVAAKLQVSRHLCDLAAPPSAQP